MPLHPPTDQAFPRGRDLKGVGVQEPFKGVINVDIRDSEPDWAPFEPPQAPGRGAERALHRARRRRLLGDELLRRADRDAEHRPDRRGGRPLHAVPHDRAVLADALVPADRAATTRATAWRASPRRRSASRTRAGRSRPRTGCSRRSSASAGWNTYMVGKWHLCPTDEMNLAVDAAQLADRPRLRALVRLPRRRDEPVVSGPRLRQPPGRPAADARGGLPPHRGHHRQGARVHQGRQGDRAGEAVLPLLRARRLPRAAPRAEGVDRQVQGPLRHGLRGDARADARPPEGARASSRQDTELPPINPIGTPETRHGPGRASRSPQLDYTRPWDSLNDDEKRLFARMAEVYAGFLAHADHHIGRLLDYLEQTGELENTIDRRRLRQRRERRGRPERLGQRDEVRQRRRPTTSPRTWPRSTSSAAPTTYNHYPNGWAMAFNTPFKMWKRYEFNGGHLRPVHHLLARRDRRRAARSASSTTTRSTSCRRSSTCSASRRRRRSRATRRRRSTASACAAASTTPSAASSAEDAVLRDARLAVDLARGLEGRHDPSDASPAGATSTTTSGSSTTPTSTAPS